jgi:simple sugar transport system ATP-binding protein
VRARDGDLEVRSGEVVGIAAVEGNGQRELLRSLAGLLARESGMVVADPVAFIPEDRTTEGLVPTFTLTENLVLGLPDDPRWSRGPWVQWDAVERRMDALIEEFGIRVARVVEGNPAVVIAENPTRGLDFQATLEVHDRLRGLARNGAAVVVYSTDLDEVLELADRVLVMYRGAVVPVPSAAEPSRATVGSLMLGGGVAAEGLRP